MTSERLGFEVNQVIHSRRFCVLLSVGGAFGSSNMAFSGTGMISTRADGRILWVVLLHLLLAASSTSTPSPSPPRPLPGEVWSAYVDPTSNSWNVKVGSDGLASATYNVRRDKVKDVDQSSSSTNTFPQSPFLDRLFPFPLILYPFILLLKMKIFVENGLNEGFVSLNSPMELCLIQSSCASASI